MTPPTPSGTPQGLAIAVGVFGLAVLFGYRQWVERHRRDAELSPEDDHHFRAKDRRRFLGSTLMIAVALGMALGVTINPSANRSMGRLFGWTWLVVASLVCVLLVLAFQDWIANRDYAIRHRRQLAAERKAIFEAELLRRRSAADNGHTDSPVK